VLYGLSLDVSRLVFLLVELESFLLLESPESLSLLVGVLSVVVPVDLSDLSLPLSLLVSVVSLSVVVPLGAVASVCVVLRSGAFFSASA